MYNLLSYPQIFYSLVFFAPFVSFIVAFSKSSASLFNFIYIYPSVHLLISSKRDIFRIGFYFFSISSIIIANDFNKYVNKLFKKNIQKKTNFYIFLLYLQTISAYLFVTGSLGLITYPENNELTFTFIMEIIFFINILIFLIIYDIIIKWFKERINPAIYIYNALMIFIVLSFFALHFYISKHHNEEPSPKESISEYLAFFFCFLKFPICGMEMQTIKLNTEKFE